MANSFTCSTPSLPRPKLFVCGIAHDHFYLRVSPALRRWWGWRGRRAAPASSCRLALAPSRPIHDPQSDFLAVETMILNLGSEAREVRSLLALIARGQGLLAWIKATEATKLNAIAIMERL